MKYGKLVYDNGVSFFKGEEDYICTYTTFEIHKNLKVLIRTIKWYPNWIELTQSEYEDEIAKYLLKLL